MTNDPWANFTLPAPPPKPTLDDVLMQWQTAKEALETAKAAEMNLRKLVVELGFGETKHEGTNTKALGQGYALKAVVKYNYSLVIPTNADADATLVDEVNKVVDNMTTISNEGSFLAKDLFKWTVGLVDAEYKKIVTEAKHNELYKKILAEVNKVVLIKEGAPTVEIKEPKAKK